MNQLSGTYNNTGDKHFDYIEDRHINRTYTVHRQNGQQKQIDNKTHVKVFHLKLCDAFDIV